MRQELLCLKIAVLVFRRAYRFVKFFTLIYFLVFFFVINDLFASSGRDKKSTSNYYLNNQESFQDPEGESRRAMESSQNLSNGLSGSRSNEHEFSTVNSDLYSQYRKDHDKYSDLIANNSEDGVSEYIYRRGKEVKIRDIYLKEYGNKLRNEIRTKSKLESYSFLRKDVEFSFLIGAGMNLTYSNANNPNISSGEKSFTNEILNINPGLYGEINVFAKIKRNLGLEAFVNYFMAMPYGINEFMSSDGNAIPIGHEGSINGVNRINAGAIFSADLKSFGKREEIMISLLFGLDFFYSDGSNFYNNNLGFMNNADPISIEHRVGETLRSLNDIFSSSFLIGARIGLMHSDKHRFIFDFFLNGGPAIFTNSIDGSLNGKILGGSFGFVANMQYNLKINDYMWFVLSLRSKTLGYLFEQTDTNTFSYGVLEQVSIGVGMTFNT